MSNVDPEAMKSLIEDAHAVTDDALAGKPKFAGPVLDPIFLPQIDALANKLWPSGGKVKEAGLSVLHLLFSHYTP